MAVFDAHPLLNRRSSNSWNIEVRDTSGGVNLDGDEQLIARPVSPWRAEIRTANLLPAERRELASFLLRLRGRVNALRIRPNCCPPDALFSRLGLPVPSASRRADGLTHADGATFSDGTGYALEVPPMLLGAGIPAFAREALLNSRGMQTGLLPGDFIGIGGRLHRVTGVYPPGTVYRITFEPATRLAFAAGTPVDLNPACTMRLVDPQGGYVTSDAASVAPVSLSLIERAGLV